MTKEILKNCSKKCIWKSIGSKQILVKKKVWCKKSRKVVINIFDTKKIWVKKNLGFRRILGQTICGSNKILWPKHLCQIKFWVKKTLITKFWVMKIRLKQCCPKIFGSKCLCPVIFGPKNFGQRKCCQKNRWSKNILDNKKFRPKKSCDQKMFGPNQILGPKRFWKFFHKNLIKKFVHKISIH